MGEASAKTSPVPNPGAWRGSRKRGPGGRHVVHKEQRQPEPAADAHKRMVGCCESGQAPATTGARRFHRHGPLERRNDSSVRTVGGCDGLGEDQVGFYAAGARRNGNKPPGS